MTVDNKTVATPWPMRDAGSVEAGEDAKEYCELIPFDEARVVPDIVNGTYFVIVSGNAPCANMAVQLAPLIHIGKPQYWGIQVIGCVGEFCLPAVKPYTVWLDVSNHRGHKGIEVIGSNKSVEIAIP